MKVALVHCPFGHRDFSENLKVVDEEFCLAPPIVLAYVAAILEKAGHEVRIIDANALKLSKEKALMVIRGFAPHIIGFRADTYWFHRVVEWATYFKQNLDAKIVVGGVNIALYPGESLSHKCFDYGIAGEANVAFPKLLACLEGGQSPEHVEGLVYRSGNDMRSNPLSEKFTEFDDYPFPARHLLPNQLYSSFTSHRKNFTILLTSIGCPFDCSFCAIRRQRCDYRSYLNVADEIERCYKDFGVREIDFFSPGFFTNNKLAEGVCKEVIKRKIKLEWSCRSRVDEVHEECLSLAYAAGCRKIYYGIESASQTVLCNVSKGTDVGQVRNAIGMTHRAHIETLGFFMVGNPGDTKETICESIEFAKSLNLDYVQVCRTIAKPNTQLNDLVIAQTGKDHWRSYILDQNNVADFPTPWTSLSREELEKHIEMFYRAFYFRLSYIIKRICGIKSFGELFRYIKVALRWFLANKIKA